VLNSHPSHLRIAPPTHYIKFDRLIRGDSESGCTVGTRGAIYTILYEVELMVVSRLTIEFNASRNGDDVP